MMNAGLAKVVSVPLQDINPNGGPYKTKKGDWSSGFALFLCGYIGAILSMSFISLFKRGVSKKSVHAIM